MYDILIIGSDLSTLIAALLSTRNGLKTALVTERDPELLYANEGYTFSPTSLPLGGVVGSDSIKHLFPDLPLFHTEYPLINPSEPVLQIISSEYRLDIFHDDEQWIQELIREFPSQERAIRRLSHSLGKASIHISDLLGSHRYPFPSIDPPKAFQQIRRFARLLRDYLTLRHRIKELSDTSRAVLGAELAVLASQDLGDLPLPLCAAYLLTSFQRGSLSPIGCRSALMDELYRQFEAEQGVLVKGCDVIRLEIDHGIIVDLNISDSPITLRSRSLIASTQWEKIDHLLLEGKCFRRLKRRIKSIPCRGYPFSLHMGVREAGLPERLAPYAALVRNPQNPRLENDYLFLETSPPREEGRAPLGKRAMTATVFLSDSPLVLSDDELRNIAGDVFSSLELLLPFLRENLDFLHVEGSIRFSREIQDVVPRKYAPSRNAMLGMNAISPKTPLPHVFLTGGLLKPGLGFEGEILSGSEAASMAINEIQKSARPLKGGVPRIKGSNQGSF